MKDWIRERKTLGAQNNILRELRLGDAEGFRRYLRMDNTTYEFIIERVRSSITKQTTTFRKPVYNLEVHGNMRITNYKESVAINCGTI